MPGHSPSLPGLHIESRVRSAGYAMRGHHCHQSYELFYVENGACRFLIDSSMHELRTGDFILAPPMSLHYTRYVLGDCKRTVILFGEEDLPEDVRRAMPGGGHFFRSAQVFQTPPAYRSYISHCMEHMLAEERIDDPRSPLLKRFSLWSLLLLCSRFCVFQDALPSDLQTADRETLQAARFINEHYMNPLTTADIARAVGFSPNYLSRKFRAAAGIGLHEYLVYARLQHAALELLSTQDSITTIALRCGFSDSNYFKDSFKKKYGLTPRQYRKRG